MSSKNCTHPRLGSRAFSRAVELDVERHRMWALLPGPVRSTTDPRSFQDFKEKSKTQSFENSRAKSSDGGHGRLESVRRLVDLNLKSISKLDRQLHGRIKYTSPWVD